MKYRIWVKRLSILMLIMISCSPVLSPRLAGDGNVNVPLESMKEYPLFFEGNVYLLGGLIIGSRETGKGTLLELGYFQVNERGFFTEEEPDGRFLALLPEEEGFDSDEYPTGNYVSMVAEFTGTESGNGLVSVYPVFGIRDIHIWGDDPKKAFTRPPLYEGGVGGDDPGRSFLDDRQR